MNRNDDELKGNLDALDEVLPENNASGEETEEISTDYGEDTDLIKPKEDEAMDEEDDIAEVHYARLRVYRKAKSDK
eukprot:1153376-Ditylum_brightwellii.AAC.1